MLIFADDTFCIKSDQHLHNLAHYINGEINKITVWFRANKLAVNVSKTKHTVWYFEPLVQKISNDIPDLVIDADEPNETVNPQLINTLERYHNNNLNQTVGHISYWESF